MKESQGFEIRRFTLTSKSTPSSIARSIRALSKDPSSSVSKRVSKILYLVRREGDRALVKLSRDLEGSKFSSSSELLVNKGEFREAYSKLTSRQVRAIRNSHDQIKWFAAKQMQRFRTRKYRTPLGFEIEESYVPLERIGGYVPGGRASYPSTVLMICAPAREAGVKEIVLATPALGGIVNPAVLVGADICGVRDVIKVGGAQGVGALAFGTNSIRRVELIAGPGNEYVTEAKKQVREGEESQIDLLAGPTELLIAADRAADPDLIFADLISQAEHGNRTICGLVSDSEGIIRAVVSRVKNARSIARSNYIAQSFLFAVKSSSLSESIEFAQAFSPEHLEAMVSKPEKYRFARAGLVLQGKFTPCSASDYIVGTNHILPTGGTAASVAGVSVETFLKRVTLVKGSKVSLARSEAFLSELAGIEGLPNHALAAKARLVKSQ